jgi:drug/metabolite transporter (DMT)-like permease
MHRFRTDSRLFIVLLIVAMAVWGGSWVSGKIITSSMHPLAVAFYRFVITFLAFIPTLFILRQKPVIDRTTVLLIAGGAAIMTGYNLLFFAGLSTGLSGSGGVLVTSINPVFTFLIASVLFRKKIRARDVVGMVLGVTGGLVLLEVWQLSAGDLMSSGNLMFIIASVLWAVLTIVSGQAQKRVSVFVYCFYLYGIASLISFFIALPFGIEKAFLPDPAFWTNIVYLSVVTSFCATTIYFFASKKLSAGRASSFSLFVPFFAVMISFLVLGEIPKPVTVIGGLCAMGAIYLINGKSRAVDTASVAAEPERAAVPADTIEKKPPSDSSAG